MQMSIFDGTEKFIIDKPIRLIELFGGYGSQALALKYLGVSFEHWKLCEWAIKSIQAYKDIHFGNYNTDYSKNHSDEFILNRLLKWGISANYNEPMTKEQIKRLGTIKYRQIFNNIKATHNLVDISQVKASDLEITDTDKYCYIMTYSFPCQDLSKAGKGAGMEKGSGTRSGLLWEVERILDECKEIDQLPQILLMENVPDVIGSKNISNFAKWLEKLEKLGYHCYWQVLNSKDFGVPQNRERCFMVSLLGDYLYEFPKKQKLEIRLKDILEKEVDEKYYLSNRALIGSINTRLCEVNIGGKYYPLKKDCENYIEWHQDGLLDMDTRVWKDDKIAPTTHTNCGKIKLLENQNKKTQLCNELIASGKVKENDVIRHSYTTSKNGDCVQSNNECPTLDTRCDCLGVVVKSNNKRLKSLVNKMDLSQDNQFMDIYNQQTSENAGTITTRVDSSNATAVYTNYRIRKLTPRECFRLMGVKDEDFDKVAKNQSNASLYHLAGDSIVVNVLMAIFKNLLKE